MDTTEAVDDQVGNDSDSGSEETSRSSEGQGTTTMSNNDSSGSAPGPTSSGGTRYRPSPNMVDVIKVLEKSLTEAKHELLKIATGSAGTQDGNGSSKENFVGEIERLPISDWVRRSFMDPSPPTLAFRAYYRKLPTWATQNSGSSPVDPSTHGFEQPHRIAISSSALVSELEVITNISIQTLPVLMKPPYKAFIQFWPEIKQRLAKLKTELQELETQKSTTPDTEPSSQDDTAETDKNNDAKNRDESGLRWRVSHLQTLRDFIEVEFAQQLRLRASVEDGTLETIRFEDLWQLFNPGDVLYSHDHGFEQLYKAYSITGGQLRLRNRTPLEADSLRREFQNRRLARFGRPPSSDETEIDRADTEEDQNPYPRGDAIGVGMWTAFTIDCFNIGMDGTRLGAIDTYKRIQRYIGEKKLTDLPIFPLRFLPNKDEVVQRLEKRGLRCAQCDGHKKYDGFVYDSKGRPSRERFRGDIFVDYKEYFRKKKRMSEPRLGFLQRTTPEIAEIEEGRGQKFDRFSMDHEIDQRNSDLFLASHSEDQKPRTREQLAQIPELLRLMCHQVVAFTFRTRKWVRLEIDYVENIDKSAEARNGGFDDLVILPKYRRLLVSLVDSHTSDTHKYGTESTKDHRPLNQLDLVRGKGLGLIVLLHGPPGTGKTSTAETIASYTGRPLYSITCGDLGSTPYQIEIKLDKHASRADKWGCVLLLDEADVFLMRRDFKDTDRNALVSIFLRTLEYYPGILFLTTNRVGVIDEAFKSRIHIALRYPRVRLTATLEIWKGCLDRIERDNEFRALKIEFDRNELMEFAEEHYHKYHKKNATWNGRQIRNAFQTAIALGQYERTSKIKKKGLTEDAALATGKKKWRAIQLTRKNLDTIAETAQDFDKYMKSVHRAPDGEVAKADQLRDDDFSESSEGGESFEEKIIAAAKRRSARRDGSKQRRSTKKKSEKAVASSSGRAAATRASNHAAKQKEHSSSDNSMSKEESRESSSEKETDDED